MKIHTKLQAYLNRIHNRLKINLIFSYFNFYLGMSVRFQFKTLAHPRQVIEI